MATIFHVGGTTDLSQIASWKTATGGAGTVPVDGDAAMFTEGSDVITGGLSTAGTDADNIKLNLGFTGRIGGSAGSWIIGCNVGSGGGSLGVFEYGAGAGYMYLTAGTNGIDVLIINGNGHAYLTGGTISEIRQFSAEMDINDTVDLSGKTVNLFGGSSTIERKADGTDPTINVYGGTHYIKRPGTTYNLYGGTLKQEVILEATAAVTVNQYGGLFDVRAGGITTYNGFGGEYTAENAIRDLTIGTANIYLTQARALQGRAAKITYTTTSLKGAADGWK